MPGRRYGGQTLPKKYRVPLENVSAIILVVIHFCTSGVLWRNGNTVDRGRRKPKRYLKQVAKSANESITKFFSFFFYVTLGFNVRFPNGYRLTLIFMWLPVSREPNDTIRQHLRWTCQNPQCVSLTFNVSAFWTLSFPHMKGDARW